MARSRYKFIEGPAPHFLTATVVNWTPLFSSQMLARFLLESLTFLQNEGRLVLYAYIILENHLHLVAAASDLSKEIGDFKSYTARQIIDFLTAHNATHVLEQLSYYKLRHKHDRNYQLWRKGRTQS